MKKNILYFCLVIVLVLHICVNADTFEESSNKVSSYLDRNEYKYHKQYRAETSEKRMEENGFNPIYIENKLSNY